MFSACIVPDKAVAFNMVQLLVRLGVDPAKEDILKQTPIFYACREGNNDVIQYLVDVGKDYVNR